MAKNFPQTLLIGVLFILTGCTYSNVRAVSPTIATGNFNATTFTKDELYFGLSKPGGGTISEAEWQLFLSSVITPRFPEGLTVVDSYGQYLNKQGKLSKEKTKLVILIYQTNQVKNQSIEDIITTYKQKFRQESVLRVTNSVQASF